MSISFDRASQFYDATRGLPSNVSVQITDCILQQVSATPSTRFFEPGIGTGRIAIPIIQRGYDYTGADISENMLAELRRKLQGSSHQLALVQADAIALPFADRSFDVALAVHLLHLISDWRTALAEIRRVLKPDGIFVYAHGRARAAVPGEDDFNQAQFDFEQQWRAILAHHGFELKEYGAAEVDVMDALSQQGATLETVLAAQWRIQRTVGELLDRHQQRLYSSSWQIPDDVFVPAITDLAAWCQQHFPSLDTDISHDAQFKMTVVRNWDRSPD